MSRKTVEFCAMQPLLPLQLSRTPGQGLPATSNMSGVYYSSSATVARPGAEDLAKLSYHKSDRGDNILFAQLSEVKEACEFEEFSGTALSQVKGSLRRHVEFWRSIGAPRYVLSVICEGCRLPFRQSPPGLTSRNQ